MQYLTIIYDFKEQLPDPYLLLMLVMFLCGLGIIYYNKNPNIEARKSGMVAGFIFSIFSGLISIIVIPTNLASYFDTMKIYNNKQYKIVEGRVTSYHPMQESGHGDRERFNVNGIDFEFSDYVATYGYNNATSKGGAIKENLLVHIYYFNNGNTNVILRLEVE